MMIYLLNFVPIFCASCGSRTDLDRDGNPYLVAYEKYRALTCMTCGITYQKADRSDLLRAATASGGDMIERAVDETNG